MKRPGLLEGVLLAAGLAFAASVVGPVLAPLIGLPAAVRLLIPGLGLAYLLYLLRRSPVRSGRVTALAAWAVIAAAAWWTAPPVALYLAIHAGALWILRVTYFHAGLLGALADLGVGVAALVLTAWAATHSGSLSLATWCFFIVQALFALIPPDAGRRKRDTAATTNEKFDRARRQAEAALHQLFTR